MVQLIEWLLVIEMSAAKLYKEASEYFKLVPDFSGFLCRNGEYECFHSDVMEEALQLAQHDQSPIKSAFKIDDEIRQHVESEVALCHKKSFRIL